MFQDWLYQDMTGSLIEAILHTLRKQQEHKMMNEKFMELADQLNRVKVI